MNYGAKWKKIMETAYQDGASDIHISAGHPPIIRVSGVLEDVEGEEKLSSEEAKGLSLFLMTSEQQEMFLRKKEIDFAYEGDGDQRFRVNAFFQKRQVCAALRVISSIIRTIDELGLPEVLHKFSQARQGFVLITGATSQGKSTTMAAIIDEINHTRRDHIITIEQPIEYLFEDDQSLIQQREVGSDTLSFPKALRATLREDPNVIMIGEMRDLETISTAITAAETGHLVFATLHTNSASQTIHRVIDVFPAHQQNQIRAQLASSLLGVVAQRLVPGLRRPFVPACEVMMATSSIANLMRENKIHEIPSVIETSAEAGMMPLNKTLSDLVRNKEISRETALQYALDTKDLEMRLRTI